MLSDERITKIFREVFNLVDSRLLGKQLEFVRAIEREATASLIEQTNEDEALMRQALDALTTHSDNGVFVLQTIQDIVCVLRQRLEAKK